MSAIDGGEREFRYRPLVKLASGGMATVYVGALSGPAGFRQIVAIKRPHAHLLEHPETREAALAEARIAARFRHANVVHVRDVEVSGEQVQLVMDYIEGATLSTLLAAFARRGERLPVPVAMRILLDACAGLAAVHEATDDAGAPLRVVHRDISPQNILVGLDGVARVSDFGTVKEPAAERPLTTQGTLKGKPGYMAPEYVQRGALDARSDELSLAVVAWETLAGKRLFRGATDFETFEWVLRTKPPALSEEVPALGAAFDEAIGRALSKDPDARFATVRELAGALGRAWAEVATYATVGEVVASVAGDELRARREELRAKLAALDAATAASDATAGPASLPGTSDATTGPASLPGTGDATTGPASLPGTGDATAIATAVTRRASGADAARVSDARAADTGGRRWAAIAVGLVFTVLSIFAAVRALRAADTASPAPAPADAEAPRAASTQAPSSPSSESTSTVAPALAATPAAPSASASSSASAPASAHASVSAPASPSASASASASARATSTKRGPKPPPPNPY